MEQCLQNGIFFITICTINRTCIFSPEENPQHLNIRGNIAKQNWIEIQKHFSYVQIDNFIIMPNHIHGIIGFKNERLFQNEKLSKPIHGSLSIIIRSYKSVITKNINEYYSTPDTKYWQRGFYEHHIRDIKKLDAVRIYINNNPSNWIKGFREEI